MSEATAEQTLAARAEAHALLLQLLPMDLDAAADLIRRERPSPEAIAMLPFQTYDFLTRETKRSYAQRARKNSLEARLKANGVKRYRDIALQAPELLAEFGKSQLIHALSKLKRKQESS